MNPPALKVRLAVFAALTGLSGCAGGLFAGGAGIGAGTCLATSSEDAAQIALAAAKPVMAEMCTQWLAEPHHQTLETWCANIPSDLPGLAYQVSATAVMKLAEDAAGNLLLPGEKGK
jgi:hypothetical protein